MSEYVKLWLLLVIHCISDNNCNIIVNKLHVITAVLRTCRYLGTHYRPEEYDSDGLSSLNYTVVSRRDMTLYTRILVNLPDSAANHRALWRMTLIIIILVCVLKPTMSCS